MKFSIVDLSQAIQQLNFRIDAEYWHPEFIEVSIKVGSDMHLGDVIKEGYRVVYENTEVFRGFGFKESNLPKFLQATDIISPTINIEQAGYVSNSDWARYPKGRVRRGEILLEVKGNVQKVAIVPDDFPERVLISGTLYKFSVNNLVNKYYLAVYLSSSYGQRLKRRLISNIATPFISKGELYSIPLPRLTTYFQEKIEQIYMSAVSLVDSSRRIYEEAQECVLSELDLANWQSKHQLAFVKHYSDTKQVERLDAEYFQPKYEEIVKAIQTYPGGWNTLGNLATVKKCVEVGSSEYVADGIPFIRVSNMSPFETTEEKYISEQLYQELKQHQPKEGEILFSKDATPGIAHYLNEAPQKMIPSGGILRLRKKSDRVNNEYLTLVLNSILTKEQANRDAGGSVILHWRPDQIKEVVIPILPDEKQTEIQQKIIEASNLRRQSKYLLECAKRVVEMAIEQDEQAATDWLEDQISAT